jgi:rubrerythrin
MTTTTKYAVAVLPFAAAAFFLMGRMTAESPVPVHPQTAENLSSAMHGEAFAFAKYMLYAEQARKSGHPELAKLFELNAHTERFEHFAEEAKLAGLVGSDEDNLRDAIKGETWEFDHMYLDFARQATEAGDMTAATRFEEIRLDEGRHRDAFQSALDQLNSSGSADEEN